MGRPIKGLLEDELSIKKAAVEQRREYVEVSVKKDHVSEYLAQGYEEFKELKTKIKLRRPITTQERLERKVWSLLYLLGYPVLQSSNFGIITDNNEKPESIEAFAKDDETVIIGKCFTQEIIDKTSWRPLLEEFSSKKGMLSKAVKSQFGAHFKPKIIWLIFSTNIIWSNEDKEYAESQKLNIITERELRYFLQISEHLRSAARYQFLAEFLKDQKIPAMQNRKVPAIRGILGGRKFYAFVSHPKELLKISFVNHRSLNDPDGAPSYQRLVNKSRLKQISEFISLGGFFPTNILINFVNSTRFDQIAKDEETGVVWGHLYLPDKYRSAWIIDGQHRLYGFAPLSYKHQSQNVVVIAFEKLPKHEEANLFVTINHEQKSVPKTLLDDLDGVLKWESKKPLERIGAISARLINTLNSDIGEPFYNKIAMQGIPANESTCLTVPAIKLALSKSGLIGSSIIKNKLYDPGPLCDADDQSTVERARQILNRYFSSIRDANLNVWHAGRSGYISTNTGVQAQLYLLAAIISYMESKTALDAKELTTNELSVEISPYLSPILKYLSTSNIETIEDRLKVQFGSGGPKEYYFRLCSIVKESFPDFTPDGYTLWEEETSDDRTSTADRKLKEINIVVQSAIFERLRDEFGDDYWDKGVRDVKIKVKAYEKSQYDENKIALENYLDFIEYKKIIENKEIWPLMKPYFNISEPGTKETAKNISWMDRINELRRIPAHATKQRNYKLEDFDYIDYIYEKLCNKIPQRIWDQI